MAVSHLPVPSSSSSPAPVVQLPEMWANSDLVFQGETFALHFKAPNPWYLGVLDPKGHFFYVVFPASDSVEKLTPLVDSQVFVHLDSLLISTSQLKADPYIYEILENQFVFTQSGTYTFVLGENLHVDDPSSLFRVKINYRHTPRPTLQVAAAAN